MQLSLDDLARLVCEDYAIQGNRSLASVENSFKQLRAFFGGDCLVAAITYARLSAYAADRLRNGRKRSTVRKELAALKRGFALAKRSTPLPVPAFPTFKIENARSGFFDRATFDALVRAAPKYLKPILTFMYVTGWRRSEVLALTWRQVDFETGIVRLEPGTTKTGDGREFPFAQVPELAQAMDDQRAWTTELERRQQAIIPWVFNKNGKRLRNFRRAWWRITKAVGLSGFIPHDFRRSAVRNFERAGVPRSVGMRLCGHKTEAVYSRYAITSPVDMARGAEQLALLFREDRVASSQALMRFPKKQRGEKDCG